MRSYRGPWRLFGSRTTVRQVTIADSKVFRARLPVHGESRASINVKRTRPARWRAYSKQKTLRYELALRPACATAITTESNLMPVARRL
jgi:hypothetical protein